MARCTVLHGNQPDRLDAAHGQLGGFKSVPRHARALVIDSRNATGNEAAAARSGMMVTRLARRATKRRAVRR